MKFVVCCAVVLALCSCALAEKKYEYIVPPASCKWGMKAETYTTNSHTSQKTWVFGKYKKVEYYNHNKDLIGARVVRPDLLSDTIFSFNGTGCNIFSNSMISFGYESVIGFSHMTFDHVEEGEYNGEECFIYYFNDEDGEPDKDADAYYVNKKGYLLGRIQNADDKENRISTNYTYYSSPRIALSDFTFDEKYAYRCSDPRVFNSPSAFFAKCAAASASSVFALVLAAVVSVLVIVF